MMLNEIHSAVALLLKAALIQVSDYRLLGASGLVVSYKISYKLNLFLEVTCLIRPLTLLPKDISYQATHTPAL
jgi:hypothetical protein